MEEMNVLKLNDDDGDYYDDVVATTLSSGTIHRVSFSCLDIWFVEFDFSFCLIARLKDNFVIYFNNLLNRLLLGIKYIKDAIVEHSLQETRKASEKCYFEKLRHKCVNFDQQINSLNRHKIYKSTSCTIQWINK